MANATTSAILDNARAALPGVGDDAIKQALFNVCDDLAREALKVAAPVNVDGAEDTWLPAAQWVPNYQALLAGTLASLYGQFAKPYFNPELAKYNLDKYLAYRTLSRTTEAADASHLGTMPDRIITTIRAQIPTCRDETIRLELYAAIDCIRVDGFNLTPMVATAADPVNWLTIEQYEVAYVAILTGTLYRLYGQAGMPWYSEAAYAANHARYEIELHKVRSYSAGQSTALDAVTERFISAARAQIPHVTDEAVTLALFDAVSVVAVDGFGSAPPLSTTSSPATWLSAGEYEQGYQAIFAGLLAGLYAQTAVPWGNLETAASWASRFTAELHKVRSAVAGSPANVDTGIERLIASVRAQVPAITDEAVQLEAFPVANNIRVGALRLPALLLTATDPANWMTPEQYADAFEALLAGTLARVFNQAGMAWFSEPAASACAAQYQQELHKLRQVEAAGPTDVSEPYDRLISVVRQQVVGVRDEATKLEMFQVVNAVRADAFRLPAIDSGSGSPTDWLTEDQWNLALNTILAGVLAKLLNQSNMPWYSAEAAAANVGLYQQELHKLRAAYAGSDVEVATAVERLEASVRAQVVGITDEAIRLELYATINEVRVDAYRQPPIGDNPDPTDWLTPAEYKESFNAILAGTLARVFGQSNMPWHSDPAQQANAQRYQQELHKVRQIFSASTLEVAFTYDRLVSLTRSAIPAITDQAIKAEAFAAVNDVRVEGFHLPPSDSGTGNPANWMTPEQYNTSFNAIIENLLARIYGQSAMPWGNEAARNSHATRYQLELSKVRGAVSGATDDTDTIAERLVSAVRAQVPLITDAAIKLALFDACNRVRVDALRLPAIDGNSNNVLDWFTPSEYQSYYNALLPGTLANIYGQAAMPWGSKDLFVAQTAIYLQEVNHLRVGNAGLAGSTDTIPERIVSTVRAQIQLVRDESVKLALFNVVNKVRAEVYVLPPLTGGSTNYTTWLSTAQYEQSYLAILYGTLAQLYGQSNMPWYNLDQFKAHNVLFIQELDLARSENIEPEGPTGSVRDILEQARAYLPGARDEVMVVELRSAMDEFLKFTQVWQEDVKFSARPQKTLYELYPLAKAELVRVIDVRDPETQIGYGPFLFYPIAKLQLKYAPSQPRSLIAVCALSILTRKLDDTCAGANWGVPTWIVERWQEVLLNGLLWRMLMQQQKSYTNTELGLFHGRRWRAGLADCRGATSQKNVYDGQTWRYPAYA